MSMMKMNQTQPLHCPKRVADQLWNGSALILVFLLFVQGCAHKTAPSPLPDSAQLQPGKTAVTVNTAGPQDLLKIPNSGRLSNVGRGAGLGAGISVAGGVALGPGGGGFVFFTLIPFSVVGGVIGAVKAEDWQKAESSFNAILTEMNIREILPERLAAFSRTQGYEIAHLRTNGPSGAQNKFDYAAIHQDGIDQLLKIQDITVALEPDKFEINPPRRLVVSARTHLIQPINGAVTDVRDFFDRGPTLGLAEWTSEEGTRFREEVERGAQRLAEQILLDYLLRYELPEQTLDSQNRGLFGPDYHIYVKGLRGIAPEERASIEGRAFDTDVLNTFPLGIERAFPYLANRSDSLLPTFRWEAVTGEHATYDLKVWRAGQYGPDRIIYSREGLGQPFHRLEMPLEASTPYYWSVRARFSVGGKTRVTDWSRRSVNRADIPLRALETPFIEEGFYVFITPPAAE
jgi:hypothetical protein